MAKSMLHAVGRPARRRQAGSTSTRPPPCPSGPDPATRGTPSRCASCSPCATGSTSWRTTSTTASPTSCRCSSATASPTWRTSPPTGRWPRRRATRFNYSSGTSNIISGVVARTVGPGESYARFLHSRLFGPLGMTSADPEFDEAGTWVASSYLRATRTRLRPLRAALPARRHVGRRPPPAGRLGGLRPHHGVDRRPGGPQPLRRALVGRARRHAREPRPLGTFRASGYEGQTITICPPST